MATEAPPPSYDSIVSKVRSRLQSDPTPEKVFSIVSNFSQVEANAVANADIDVAEHMSAIDQDKFNEGVNEYLRTEAARLRLEYNADEATNACRLIETMFNNLAVRLGQIDGMNLGKTKFMPRFKELQQSFRTILHHSTGTALEMAAYGRRFDERILKICLNKQVPEATKKAKLDEFIQEGQKFADQAQGITDAFKSLATDFGAFTGSFATWADGEEKKNDPEMEQLNKDIRQLQEEIDEYKAKMVKWGVIGTIGTVGITVGLCFVIGPFALLAGLIGAGVTIGLMVHWSNQITNLQEQKQGKEKRLKDLISERDSIIATRHQLVELGQNSFKTFSGQVEVLNQVWTWAMNDASKVKLKLDEIKKDVRDLDDALLREYIMPVVGGSAGLYSLMATYLERYADGVTKAGVPNP